MGLNLGSDLWKSSSLTDGKANLGYDTLWGTATATTLTLNLNFLLNSGTAITSATVKGPTLTFTRAGNAMSFNSAGNLSYAPHQMLENANLGTRTGDLPSGWLWGGETGSITWLDIGDYSQGTFTVSASRQYVDNIVDTGIVGGVTYTIGVYVASENLDGNAIFLRSTATGGVGGDIKPSDLTGVGWYGVGSTQGASDAAFNLQVGAGCNGNETGNIVLSRPFIVKGLLPGVGVNSPAKLSGPPLGRWIGTDDGDEPLYDQPRFAHDPANSNSKLGLLMEEARTNLQVYSQIFDPLNSGWTETLLSAADNSVVSPDGSTNATTCTETTDNNIHRIHDGLTISPDTNYAISIFAKGGTKDFVFISLTKGGGTEEFISAVFDVSSDSTETAATETDVGTTSGTILSTSQEAVGNDWFRITLVGQYTDTAAFMMFGFAEAATGNAFDDSGSIPYIGTSQTAHFWQAQVELGTFATSPIPTTTATVTRAADNCTFSPDGWSWDRTTGTFFVALHVLASKNNAQGIVYIDDTDEGFRYYGATGDRTFLLYNGAVIFNDTVTEPALGTNFKGIVAWDSGGGAISVDGSAVETDGTYTVFASSDPTVFGLGAKAAGSASLDGYFQTLKYNYVRKENDFLISETT